MCVCVCICVCVYIYIYIYIYMVPLKHLRKIVTREEEKNTKQKKQENTNNESMGTALAYNHFLLTKEKLSHIHSSL